MENVYQIIGWIGTGFIIVAYILNVRSILTTDTYTYHALNAVGSTLIIISSVDVGNWPVVGLNMVWAGVAFIGIWDISKKSST